MAFRHVAFEDLGILGPLLAERGFATAYIDPARDSLDAFDPAGPDLLVVLGGPIGAYEEEAYPFLSAETDLIAARLDQGLPTIGICLGAQLMAKALGARVYPSGIKEIGWAPVTMTAEGEGSCLSPLGEPGISVLHWHGDTFDLPAGATHLAATGLCAHQAFSVGATAIGLQFHLETPAEALESWFVGHAVEIAAAGLSVTQLREATQREAAACNRAGRACFARWLGENYP